MNKAKILPQGSHGKTEKKTRRAFSENTARKILVIGLITLVVIQIVVVIVLIYLGVRVGDLSSEIDDVKENVSSEHNRGQQDPETPDQEISAGTLIFSDEFNYFNLTRWKHEITLGGGGNWEFQYYDNNRSNSYVKDDVLYLKPSFLADDIGEDALRSGYKLDLWGSQPADVCTGPHFYYMDAREGAVESF